METWCAEGEAEVRYFWLLELFVAATLVTVGCAASTQGRLFTEGLAEGGVLAPNGLTDAIISGDFKLTRSMLEDTAALPVHFSINGISEFEGTTHYLASSASEYLLCLLEIRSSKTTREILAEAGELPTAHFDSVGCGPCCGGLVPLPPGVSETLRRYWITVLALR